MADEDIRKGEPDRPRKRPPEDDDDDRPRKPRRREEEDEDDGSNSPVSALVPVGVSIWALASLYLSLLGCVIPGFGLLGVICGILAFVTHKQKASYGSISGNMRAIMGILIGVVVTAFQIIGLIMMMTMR